jgi:phosphomethylpyrimidine synthase
MELTQQVRDYAAATHVTELQALKDGMKAKSEEFKREGGEIYVPQG